MRVFQTLQSELGRLLNCENAQDLVEYAMAVSLIALALIGGMNKVATALISAFTNISTTLTPAPPSHDYDHLGPGPMYGLPGWREVTPGIVLAVREPDANPHPGSRHRHAAAIG